MRVYKIFRFTETRHKKHFILTEWLISIYRERTVFFSIRLQNGLND